MRLDVLNTSTQLLSLKFIYLKQQYSTNIFMTLNLLSDAKLLSQPAKNYNDNLNYFKTNVCRL